MIIVKIADIVFKINCRGKYLEHLCKDYITNDENIQCEITITDQDIEYEASISKEVFPKGYLEAIAAYRLIEKELYKYDAFLFHSSVVEVDGMAYGFAARAGTGKTTHSKLWLEYLPSKARIINGDKPIIRLIDNIPYIYGTPWNGKEGYGINTKAPLKAICFIERAKDNSIRELNDNEINSHLFLQLLIPSDESIIEKYFDNINRMMNYTKFYLLKCNMDIEAAKIAYEKMK